MPRTETDWNPDARPALLVLALGLATHGYWLAAALALLLVALFSLPSEARK